MKIVILGGEGFIGKHLKNKLKNKYNYHIVSIDKQGSPDFEVDLANLSNINKKVLYDTFKEADVIYHLASPLGVDNVLNNPSQTLDEATHINDNLFPLFEKAGKKVIFASTSEVYGEYSKEFLKETDNLCISNPYSSRSTYAVQKIFFEFKLMNLANFPINIVRFFNVIGKGQNESFVFPKFMKQALNNKEITVSGDGSNMRSYCDIRDAVEALEKVIDINDEIINIGNYNIYSDLQLAKIIVEEVGSNSIIGFTEPRKEDIKHRVPNLDLMHTFYEPKYSLKDTIEAYLNDS
jgi:nucleoside-diphosphate-sugar epimerase